MSKVKAVKIKSSLKMYPPYQQIRSGCKVSWYYYEKEEDAQAASLAARHNGGILADQGYDFGYQSPGYRTRDQAWFPGLIEVCIP